MRKPFVSRFKQRLETALAERAAVNGSPAWRLLITAVVFVLCYIFLALVFRPKNTTADHHFVNEDGAITALSAILMAIAAGMTFSAYFIAKQRKMQDKLLWLLFALGFGFLALDELLELHEHVGGLINVATKMIGVDSGVFRNWNDIIVIGYGLVALPFILYFLPAVLRYPGLMERLALAALFFAIHTVIDSVSEPQTVRSGVMEESAKLFCALFLALSAVSALVGALLFGRSAEKRDQ